MSDDLTNRLWNDARIHRESFEEDGSGSPITAKYLEDAAQRIEALQAENEQLRAAMEVEPSKPNAEDIAWIQSVFTDPRPMSAGDPTYPDAERSAKTLENATDDLITEAAFVRWQGRQIEALQAEVERLQSAFNDGHEAAKDEYREENQRLQAEVERLTQQRDANERDARRWRAVSHVFHVRQARTEGNSMLSTHWFATVAGRHTTVTDAVDAYALAAQQGGEQAGPGSEQQP